MALDAGATVEAVYVAPEGRTNDGVGTVVDRAFSAGVRVFDLGPGVIERVSDTVHPQPVLAVVGFTPAPLEAVRAHSSVLVLVDVRDPGNAGTIIRTADASGIGVVIHCDGSVDPTNPKVVRASAGSIFHVPVVLGGDPVAVVDALRGWEFETVGTAVRGGLNYADFDWRQRVAMVFGNEATGLDEVLISRLDARVSVPMVGRAESLNVAVSASVLCFEALRQRRSGGVVDPANGGPAGGPTTEPTALRSTISDMQTAPQAAPGQTGPEADHG